MSLKVLICDADWRFVEHASQFLGTHGHHVMSEPLPSEAIDLARRWKPDILIISSEATEGSNDQFLSQIRRLNPRPAILLTGQLDRFDAAWRAWQRGGDELLLKPIIHAWELHTAIISALKAATDRAEAPTAATA